MAWAAGIYEGEGTAYTPRTQKSPVLCVQMDDEDVVRAFAEAVGIGGVNGPYVRKRNGKLFWQWRAHGKVNLQKLAHEFWPYLGERRKAQLARVLSGAY